MVTKEELQSMAREHAPIVSKHRRHLHRYPELSFHEHNTAAYVAGVLQDLGIEFQTGVAGTGIVAILRGEMPGSKVIALRADLDALPIQEENTVDYASQNAGVMHACGHDVHTSSLLGVAALLQGLRARWGGTIKLLFQPGEELLPGGASLMIAAGALKNPEPTAILGQHVFPELPAGKVGFKAGMYMASADEIYITVKGKGGHAALPARFTDPILAASHMLVALQQVVSRKASPELPTVLSFGKFNSVGGANNIIPNEVRLEGTLRTFDEAWRYEAHRWIEKIARDTCSASGCEAIVDIQVGYPFLTNDEELTHKAKRAAVDYLGEENVVDLGIRMTAEDFSYYSQIMPGCFYRLGTASADGKHTSGLHTPTFDIDETALETSIGLMAWLALQELNM
ncbi:MAG: hypothetical protein RL226_404 [Bacteroidota bacterium]